MTLSNEDRPVLVVSPLAEEIEPFIKTLPEVEELPFQGSGRFFRGSLTVRRVIAGWTGDGRRAAREGLEALLDEHQVSHVVGLGVAGGLTDGLSFAHLVVAREVRDAEGLIEAPDSEWIDRAMTLPGMREAIFYSSDRIVASAADKDALGRRLLDESTTRVGAAVVDLESATIARTAVRHGLPYTVIRAVSDAVDETLPLDFSRFCDEDGRTLRGRVILHALARPWTIPALLGLRSRLRFCGQRLNDAAIMTLLADASGGPSPGFGGGMMITSAG